MNNSVMLLAAIHDGATDDATISAAIDALREDSNLSVLTAVLEVARVHKAHTDARQMATAAEMIRQGSVLRKHLRRVIIAECPCADEDGSATITIEPGERWPLLTAFHDHLSTRSFNRQHISVGAVWVINRGNVIRDNLAKQRASKRAIRVK